MANCTVHNCCSTCNHKTGTINTALGECYRCELTRVLSFVTQPKTVITIIKMYQTY